MKHQYERGHDSKLRVSNDSRNERSRSRSKKNRQVEDENMNTHLMRHTDKDEPLPSHTCISRTQASNNERDYHKNEDRDNNKYLLTDIDNSDNYLQDNHQKLRASKKNRSLSHGTNIAMTQGIFDGKRISMPTHL